jgi:hypothetical protein
VDESVYLEDSKASLAMRLSPLLALWIPELDRGQSCPRHAQVGGVEYVARLAVDIGRAVTETKNLQSRELTASYIVSNRDS